MKVGRALNIRKDEDREQWAKIRKFQERLVSKELPTLFSWFLVFIYSSVGFKILWTIIIYNTNISRINGLKISMDKIALQKHITSASLDLGYKARRTLLQNMVPGQSTYKMIFHSDDISPGTLPMKEKYEDFLVDGVHHYEEHFYEKHYNELFDKISEFPHYNYLYRNPLINKDQLFPRKRRFQEILQVLANNGVIVANFTNWDGELLNEGSTSKSEIASQISSYFVIVDNVYFTIYDNFLHLNNVTQTNILVQFSKKLNYQKKLFIVRLSTVFCLCGILTFFINSLGKKTGDVWDFYGCVEKPWILHQSSNIQKYIAHVQQSKSQRRKIKNQMRQALALSDLDDNDAYLDGLQFSEKLSSRSQMAAVSQLSHNPSVLEKSYKKSKEHDIKISNHQIKSEKDSLDKNYLITSKKKDREIIKSQRSNRKLSED